MADAFGIDKSMLSPMVEISSVLGGVSGDVAQKTGFVEGTPLVVGTGDQQCAAVGAGVIDEGHASLTLGTSGFLVVGTKSPDVSKTPGVMLANNAGNADLYELECLQMGAASGYRWLRDTLCRAEIQEARRTGRDAFDLMGESVRATPPGSNGVLFLPFLQASGYPRWIGDVRASFVGLKMTNTRADMIRSVMEGISLECKDMYQALTAAGIPINTVTLTGGASKSPEWRQIIADMFNCPARQLEVPDATVVAAAIFCGVGAGVFRNTYEGVQKMVRYKETIQPIPENVERYGKIYGVYCELVQNASLFNSMAAL
jgi:xylulokinase